MSDESMCWSEKYNRKEWSVSLLLSRDLGAKWFSHMRGNHIIHTLLTGKNTRQLSYDGWSVSEFGSQQADSFHWARVGYVFLSTNGCQRKRVLVQSSRRWGKEELSLVTWGRESPPLHTGVRCTEQHGYRSRGRAMQEAVGSHFEAAPPTTSGKRILPKASRGEVINSVSIEGWEDK